jgi:spore germination protein
MSYLRSKRNIPKKKLIYRKRFWLITIGSVFALTYLFFTSLSEQEPITISSKPARLEKPAEEAPLPPLPEKFEAPEGSIFVPYWKISNLKNTDVLPDFIKHKNLRHVIYFGVTPLENGALDQLEPGYTNVATFAQKTSGWQASKLLTIRMMNEDITEAILADPVKQEKLTFEAIELAKHYSFNGILFDIEHSVLATKDTIDAITSFLQYAAKRSHDEYLPFSVALYGDVFYRQRPYDVEKIASFSDEIFVMAYDFHKSYGEPGPNYPLSKGTSYPYDFVTMTNDFLKVVPEEKLTILFGLFGYDWSVDAQNRPATSAKALTLFNAEHTLNSACETLSCSKNRDPKTQEINVTYIEKSGQRHNVWYEDGLSIKAKISYLSTKYIRSVGYWAFGYY